MSESECGDGADDGDVCKSVCACVRVSSQPTMMTGIVNFFLKLPRPLGRLFLVEEVGVERGCQMWTFGAHDWLYCTGVKRVTPGSANH